MKNNFIVSLGTWSGFIWITMVCTMWFLSEWFPPFAPDLTAIELADIYKENNFQLLLGGVLMMLSGLVLGPYVSVLVLLIEKVEKKMGVVSIAMIMTGATSVINVCLSGIFWAAAAFRPDRNPEVIQGLSDIAWLFFFGGISAFLGLIGWVAYASLVLDDRKNPVFSRWFGYLCLWTTIVTLPDILVFFFKTGPFAWDGLIGFWIPLVLFVVTFNASPFALRKSVKNHL